MSKVKAELERSFQGSAEVDYPGTTRGMRKCTARLDRCRFILFLMDISDGFTIRLNSCQSGRRSELVCLVLPIAPFEKVRWTHDVNSNINVSCFVPIRQQIVLCWLLSGWNILRPAHSKSQSFNHLCIKETLYCTLYT